jgi:hypothetical protein
MALGHTNYTSENNLDFHSLEISILDINIMVKSNPIENAFKSYGTIWRYIPANWHG